MSTSIEELLENLWFTAETTTEKAPSFARSVITYANQDDITHSILSRAVTRARESLMIFGMSETQQVSLKSLRRSNSPKDIACQTAVALRRSPAPVVHRDEVVK